MAEQARLGLQIGLQIGSQLDSKSASAAALLREEELPQSSGAEPPALAR